MKIGYIGLLLSAALISCKENDVESQGLIGKWKLMESYRDIGNGSGTWMKADNAYILEIRTDSTVAITGKGSFLMADSAYVLNKVNQMYLRFKSRRGTIYISAAYKVTDSDLELTYSCFEGCGDRFKAVK